MTKRIVYVDPGDMIEVRVCDPVFDLPACASTWRESIRPRVLVIAIDSHTKITVPPLCVDVWSGNRQMLASESRNFKHIG